MQKGRRFLLQSCTNLFYLLITVKMYTILLRFGLSSLEFHFPSISSSISGRVRWPLVVTCLLDRRVNYILAENGNFLWKRPLSIFKLSCKNYKIIQKYYTDSHSFLFLTFLFWNRQKCFFYHVQIKYPVKRRLEHACYITFYMHHITLALFKMKT